MEELGLCRCGCGNPTKIAPRTHSARGWIKGQPQRYLRGHAAWKDSGPKWTVNSEGCWMWLRGVDPQGYARGGFVSRGYEHGSHLVHRILYLEKFGPIPNNAALDHLCHSRDASCPGGLACPHRRCVNPDHGEPVTELENVHRSVSTKAQESDIGKVYEMRLAGISWRQIAPRFGMTHPPLITRLRKFCERNGLEYP